jgi:hypothetical protein
MNQGQMMIGLPIQKEAIMKDQKKKNMCLEIFFIVAYHIWTVHTIQLFSPPLPVVTRDGYNFPLALVDVILQKCFLSIDRIFPVILPILFDFIGL